MSDLLVLFIFAQIEQKSGIKAEGTYQKRKIYAIEKNYILEVESSTYYFAVIFF